MKQLQCGAAQRCITPDLGLFVPGYFEFRAASGVKSDLYTQALVLENDGKLAVLISMDIIFCGAPWTAKIRKMISQKIGADPESIMVSATHIHTGGPYHRKCWNGATDDKSRDMMIEKTVEAAIEAYETRVPVRFGYAKGEEKRISFRRHYRMTDGSIRTNPGRKFADQNEGPVGDIDYSVNVLRFENEAGKPIAEVVNFACHPDTVGGTEYCADYPGEMRRILKETYGEDVTVLFLNGPCGNINHIDGMRYKSDPDFVRYPADHYKWMGKCLAETVIGVNQTLKAEKTEATIAYGKRVFRAERRQPTEKEIAWAKAVAADPDAKYMDKTYARQIDILVNKPMYAHNIEVQAVRLGDCAFVGLPFETFAGTGLQIKAISPIENTMVVAPCNDHKGYLPIEPVFSGGAGVYESRLSTTNSCFYPETSDKSVAVAKELLESAAEK